jgi:hypothetical protein
MGFHDEEGNARSFANFGLSASNFSTSPGKNQVSAFLD